MIKLLTVLAIFIIHVSCSKESSHERDQRAIHNQLNAVIQISVGSPPRSLDPRIGKDTSSLSIIQMLYDGLTRITEDGAAHPSVAESYSLSDDKKTYTFHLRKSQWSNGEEVTAYDFAKSWKSVLNPKSQNNSDAYKFYMIRNAREAHEGKISLDSVGIDAINKQTLVVELERVTPHFLEAISLPNFFPVYNAGNHTEELADMFVSNGPFQLKAWDAKHHIEVVKNHHYWDTSRVKINEIITHIANEEQSVNLFQQGHLDWMDVSPYTLSIDALSQLVNESEAASYTEATVHWLRFNVKKPPLDRIKLRKALAYAVDRKLIIDELTLASQTRFKQQFQEDPMTNNSHENVDILIAQKLFKDALREMDTTVDALPTLTLTFQEGEKNKKVAQIIQEQWSKTLHMLIDLEELSPKEYYKHIQERNYQMTSNSWIEDIGEAIPLEMSETVMIDEMIAIPMYYYTIPYIKKEKLKNIVLSDMGFPDFKWASVE